MHLKLLDCDDSDMARTFAILSEAFGNQHIYIDKVFPHHMSPEGRTVGTERMLAIKHADPNTKFLKVVDEDTGEMVAQAKWNIYRNTIPEEAELDGNYWESDEEKEIARHLYRRYLEPRRQAIRQSGGNLLSLDILTVDPKWQKKGAGRMLVKWGTDLADSLGVAAVVEASNEARDLYKSEGFEIDSYKVIDYPEKWAHLKKQPFIWMVRPVPKK